MANSKIQLANGTVLLDLTSDTVRADVLRQGYTAHDKAGNPIVGTATGGGTLIEKTLTENGVYNASDDGADGYSKVTVNTQAYISDNLHNFATDKREVYINNVDGAEVPYAGWTATDYIPVDNSSIYFFNLSNIWCACYDANKNFVSFPTEGVRVQQFTDTRIKYFRASFADENMANFNMQMIVSGELPPNIRTQSKTATANGDVYPDDGYHLSKVTVALPYYNAQVEPVLPSGYTPAEYIESNGTQYINTEYVHKSNTRIVLDCTVTQTERDGYIALFGSMNPNYNNAAFVFFSRFANAHIPTLTRTGNEMRGAGMIYGTRITVDALGVAAFWGTAETRGAVASTGTADNGVQPMALFAIREGSNYTRMAVMRLYGAKFYEGETLVRNYVPCKNASGVYGLYEMINGRFFASAGSGQFTGV